MIVKGTADYKKAQEIANEIKDAANQSRTNRLAYEIYFDELGRFLMKISELNVFAAKVAQTIDKNMNPYSYTVARISDKQSWILATAAVENGIEF